MPLKIHHYTMWYNTIPVPLQYISYNTMSSVHPSIIYSTYSIHEGWEKLEPIQETRPLRGSLRRLWTIRPQLATRFIPRTFFAVRWQCCTAPPCCPMLSNTIPIPYHVKQFQYHTILQFQYISSIIPITYQILYLQARDRIDSGLNLGLNSAFVSCTWSKLHLGRKTI